ncbi:MarR family winged helix-turn-helix transcriptional regulator [Leucobacter tenebrionis]|uniref:MarR family winged helix-turn-helix transcriptional regulator n=1 Tax=Leucobacter tenebrionis TaxID=2873270 RepID=UPI001CA718D3|nr:MarR family transcriptional regulator [Leucobacter tenebrionis]QZY52383.1 MarR family transcriptional regulator [Leucobacter tenebrionis]
MNDLVGVKQQLLLKQLGDDEAARLVMAVLTTARRIDAACAELLAQHDLTEGRLAALLAISAEPGVTPRALAHRLEVTSATVTGLLDRLDRDGLIVRRAHATDRRTHTLGVTAVGEQLVSELVPVYADWLRRLGDGIGQRDRRNAESVLAAVQQNLAGDAR